MPILNIILSPLSKVFRSVSGWLAAQKASLELAGFQSSGRASRAFGPLTINALVNTCNAVGKAGKHTVEDILGEYEKGHSTEHNLIWLGSPLAHKGMTRLKSALNTSKFFSAYKIRIINIIHNPLQLLLEQVSLKWQAPQNLQPLLASLLDTEKGSWALNQALALENAFGPANCHFLPFTGDYRTFGRDFLEALGFPAHIEPPKAPLWPLSFAGLDFYNACREFPFSVFPEKFDQEKDLAFPLIKAEKESRYEVFNHLPAGFIGQIKFAFEKPNSQFIARFGPQFAFLNDWPMVDPMPEKRPGLDRKSCEVFLASLNPAFRKELEDYFQIVNLPWKQARRITNFIAGSAKKGPASRPGKTPLLSVLTLAHNHRDYILQCMESVAEQVTDFPIEHIILDDLSSDGTQDIIDNFASSHSHVKPIYLPYTKRGRNILRLFNACRTPYAALCDGDDYFIYEHKLQRQFEFLEKNRDCGLCFHFVETRFEDDAQTPFIFPKRSMLPGGLREKYTLTDLLRGNFIQTNSVLYRWRFREGLPDWFRPDLCPADWYWHILHAEMGNIGFIPEIWSVYRKHKRSIYADSFQASSVEHHRKHGLGELETFATVNSHFNERYFGIIAGVANGVFADYCKIFDEEDDSSWLDKGIELYPKFGAYFLNSLKALETSD